MNISPSCVGIDEEIKFEWSQKYEAILSICPSCVGMDEEIEFELRPKFEDNSDI